MTKKKSGRPPQTSREDILNTAMLILREGEGAFTIRSLAQRLGTAPTSIYNYFRNKDDLLAELAALALKDMAVDCAADRWDIAIRDWMNRSLALMVKGPELMQLIALVASSAAIVTKLEELAGLIQQAGLAEEDAARQAQSLLWEVVGFAVLQLGASDSVVVERNRAVWNDPVYANFGKYMAVDHFEALWCATVDRSIAGIAALKASG